MMNSVVEKELFLVNDDDAIEFTDHIHPRIKIRPMYYHLGLSTSSRIFGRQIVLHSLLKAIQFLPDNAGFLIWDIYRPRSVQKKLFEWMKTEIRKKKPWLSDMENDIEAKKYASPPSVPGEDYCPPHLSGGAIDLTLLDLSSGEPFNMGTEFDDCTELAHSNFFEKNPPGTEENQKIHKHRSILSEAMELAGFVRYQYEWWHFDMGNTFWSRATGKEAMFGPLYGDREWGVEF